jgi:hypothetical protein
LHHGLAPGEISTFHHDQRARSKIPMGPRVAAAERHAHDRGRTATSCARRRSGPRGDRRRTATVRPRTRTARPRRGGTLTTDAVRRLCGPAHERPGRGGAARSRPTPYGDFVCAPAVRAPRRPTPYGDCAAPHTNGPAAAERHAHDRRRTATSCARRRSGPRGDRRRTATVRPRTRTARPRRSARTRTARPRRGGTLTTDAGQRPAGYLRAASAASVVSRAPSPTHRSMA